MAERPKTLSAAFVKTVRASGRYGDGRGGFGLSLLVKATSTGRLSKTWSQRLRINGKPAMIGLGAYPVVTLGEARAKALENRRALAQGRDPRGERAVTFEQAAERVIALHAPNWRDPRRVQNWRSSLERFVYPRLGSKPVAEIEAADILAVISPIWADRRESARKVLGRIRAVLRWAVAEGLRGDDPSDAVRAALPKNGTAVRHHRALPHGQVADAIRSVRASGAWAGTKLAFRFTVLTAARSGEVRGARWSEIDRDDAVWTIPGDRAKTNRPHRVPLSPEAFAVLEQAEALANSSGLIFPSPTERQLSNATMGKLLADLDIPAVPHGFRSSFRSWAAEQGVPREVAEQMLGHAVRGVEGAYQRSDLLEARRPVMDRWAEYVTANP